MNIINRFRFKDQLLLFFTIGIVVMLSITSYVQYLTAKTTLRDKQIEQGLKISQSFAGQSLLAILYDSGENAEAAIESTLEFPDVVAAEIFRSNGSRLLFAGDKTFKSYSNRISQDDLYGLHSENEAAWFFVAPVANHSDSSPHFESVDIDQDIPILGHVRLTFSKESLNKTAQAHFWSNIYWTIGLGSIFIIFLMWVVTRLTNPINDLVNIMNKAQDGERGLEANITGPRDIQILAAGYNDVVRVRENEEIQIKVDAELARATAEMQGEFTAKVSHELRTPMNGIMGTIDLIEDEGNLSPKQAELVDVMHRSANMLLEFINDILDYSKADAGKLKVDREDFYIADICQNTVDLMIGEARRKEIDIGIAMELDLPDLVHGDKGKIRQILTNLIGNSIKFTDSGEIIIHVELVEELESLVAFKFTVEDTGIGIPNAVLDTIFEPFSQIDTSSNVRHGGSGLGLTISKQLVELMGGNIGVTSTPGVGSKFTFTIPFEPAKGDSRTNLEKYRPDVAGLRILVVDDSTVNRMALSAILKRWDTYEQVAPDVKSALHKLRQAALKKKYYDFIIIDQNVIPKGYTELVSRISSDTDLNRTRIILVFNSNKLGKSEAYEAGVAGIVERPIRDTKLYQCITNIMNSKGNSNISETPDVELLPIDRKILVVEDTGTNQIVAEEILTRLGCTVDMAFNGQDAIDNYFHKKYDLIFMDCRMPGVDGYEATKIFREQEAIDTRIPVIAMTANNEDDSNKQLCFESGMDDFLRKPLSLKSVKGMLTKWANQGLTVTDKEIDNIQPQRSRVSQLASTQQINRVGLQRLIDDVGIDSVKRMAKSFSVDLPDKLVLLREALEQDDRGGIINISHSLKSSALNFGADIFASIAKKLELTAKHELIHVIAQQIDQLVTICPELEAELHQIYKVESNIVSTTANTYRILIAEDNESERIALSSSLKASNISIDTVCTGTEAVEYCQNSLPDLILLDAIMPESGNPSMDGFVACRMIKELPGSFNVPILMVTGLNDQDSIRIAMDSGAADFISKPINYRSLQKRVNHILGSSHSERQLQKLAYTDPLTGLPNRANFVDHASNMIRKPHENGALTAIIFIGLNQIDFIKRSRGHEVCELVMLYVSKRLKMQTSDTVFAAKATGDEFSFVLHDFSSVEEVEVFAQMIRDELADSYHILNETIQVSATLGISVYPNDGKELGSLMMKADTAMFSARESGHGYLFYEEAMGQRKSKTLKVLSGLENAIIGDDLVVYYQPYFNVELDKIDGCEALVRWDSTEYGLMLPTEFISHAEESGLISKLGDWVILSVCKQLSQWKNDGLQQINCAINISGKQLEDATLADRVASMLITTGANANNITFEITENSLISNPEQCLSTLKDLKAMGFSVAVDDFGTGFNTFSHLVKYPIDIIKIDRSFISALHEDGETSDESTKLVQSILSVAKSLAFKVVAEGVETHYQKSFLIDRGCEYLQGYLIGKPMSSAVFEQSILRQLSRNKVHSSVTPISKGKPTKNRRKNR